MHLIYEYVPFSLVNCIQEITANLESNDYENHKKILKNIASQLGLLTDFLCTMKIKTDISYHNIGVDNFQFLG